VAQRFQRCGKCFAGFAASPLGESFTEKEFFRWDRTKDGVSALRLAFFLFQYESLRIHQQGNARLAHCTPGISHRSRAVADHIRDSPRDLDQRPEPYSETDPFRRSRWNGSHYGRDGSLFVSLRRFARMEADVLVLRDALRPIRTRSLLFSRLFGVQSGKGRISRNDRIRGPKSETEFRGYKP
jgi:hypothetical protein